MTAELDALQIVAHREAVEEAMTAFGFYVTRRIARGWSAIEVVS